MKSEGAPAGSRALAAHAAKMARDYPDQYEMEWVPPEVIPTGCPPLDWALRCGGFLRGRVYEIVGVKDAGKSTVVLTAAGVFQRLYPDRGVAYLDVENTFDLPWATSLGADCSLAARKAGRWQHYKPKTSEAASDQARDAITSGMTSLVIVDSIGGMESKKALEKDAEKLQVGSNAQVITRMSKQLSSLARLNGTTVLLVNQYRANVGAMFGGDVSAGPKAMQHSTTAKIEMAQVLAQGATRKAEFWGEEEAVGNMSRARVTRMKNGARSRVAEFWIMTQGTEEFGGRGIDLADSYYRLGKMLSIIEPLPGSYYMLPGDVKLHGEAAVLRHLRADPSARDAIRAAMPFDKPVNDDDPEGTA